MASPPPTPRAKPSSLTVPADRPSRSRRPPTRRTCDARHDEGNKGATRGIDSAGRGESAAQVCAMGLGDRSRYTFEASETMATTASNSLSMPDRRLYLRPWHEYAVRGVSSGTCSCRYARAAPGPSALGCAGRERGLRTIFRHGNGRREAARAAAQQTRAPVGAPQRLRAERARPADRALIIGRRRHGTLSVREASFEA